MKMIVKASVIFAQKGLVLERRSVDIQRKSGKRVLIHASNLWADP